MTLLLAAAAAFAVQTSPPLPAPPAPPARGTLAVLSEGYVSEDDYPADAIMAGAEGTVTARYTIGRDGRVTQCEAVKSSGHASLDAVTCAILLNRFVFRPARDARGRRIEEVRQQRMIWRLPPDPVPEAPPVPAPAQ
jgi:protein TonB